MHKEIYLDIANIRNGLNELRDQVMSIVLHPMEAMKRLQDELANTTYMRAVGRLPKKEEEEEKVEESHHKNHKMITPAVEYQQMLEAADEKLLSHKREMENISAAVEELNIAAGGKEVHPNSCIETLASLHERVTEMSRARIIFHDRLTVKELEVTELKRKLLQQATETDQIVHSRAEKVRTPQQVHPRGVSLILPPIAVLEKSARSVLPAPAPAGKLKPQKTYLQQHRPFIKYPTAQQHNNNACNSLRPAATNTWKVIQHSF